MEPHRPQTRSSDADALASPRKRSARDRAPLDARWLEAEAVRYLSRWEASRAGVCAAVERGLRRRCDRTGEDAEALVDAIPEVVRGLVERGYIDDRRYAEQLVERARRAGRSRAQIEAQFEAKGLDAALAREIEAERRRDRSDSFDGSEAPGRPEDEDEDEEIAAAWRTARKRRLGPYCTDPAKRAADRERHLGVLARKGFSREISHRIVDAESPPEPGS